MLVRLRLSALVSVLLVVVFAPFDTARAASPPGAVAAAGIGGLMPGRGQYVAVAPSTPVAGVSLAAGGIHTVTLAGANGIPAAGQVSAVAMHVVAYTPAANGSLQVYPAGTRPAGDSTVHYTTGRNSSGLEIVPTSAAGQVSFYSTAATKLYVRLLGYFTSGAATKPGSTYVPLAPVRLANAVSVPANGTTTVNVAGANGVAPAGDVAAVSVVVGVTAPAAAGYVQVYAAGSTPTTGHAGLYYPALENRSLAHIVPLSADGKLAVTTSAATKIDVYLRGYYQRPTSGTAAGASYVPVAPATIANDVPLAANASTTVAVAGANGVPAASNVAAVVTNLLAKTPSGAGQLKTWPGGAEPVDASVVHANGVSRADLDTARLNEAGQFVVKATGATTLNSRLRGYFARATVPGSPGAVTAVAGDGQATVTWTAPESDGGAAITRYTVTAAPGGRTAVATAGTSAVVTGLTNGQGYTFTVTATSAAGTSLPSGESDPVNPAESAPSEPTGPLASPTITQVYPRDGAVRVSWSPPEGDASTVTKYVVRSAPGDVEAEAPGDATEVLVGGLTNGTDYQFAVQAVSTAGPGTVSAWSDPVAPEPASVPLKPALGAVVPLDGRIEVQWSPPADGGGEITGYTLSAEPGGHSVPVPADTTVAALTGLTNGTAYTVRVTAANRAGTSAAAIASGVTPQARRAPRAPTDVQVGANGSGSVGVQWSPPVDVGTSPITSYTVTADPGGTTVRTSEPRATVTGLDPATAYTFTITAHSAAGASVPSAATEPLVPKLAVAQTPVVLTAAAAATLRSVAADGVLTFEQPPAQVTDLTPGDLLILEPTPAADGGFLGRVASVRRDGSRVFVSTHKAALSDALSEGSLFLDSRLESNEITGFTPLLPGVRRSEPTISGRTPRESGPGTLENTIIFRNGTLVVEIERQIETPNHLIGKLEGVIEIEPKVRTRIDIKNRRAAFEMPVRTNFDFRVKIGYGGKIVEKAIPLAKVTGPCITFMAGPVPVAICPKIELQMKIEVDGSVGVSSNIEYGHKVGARVVVSGNDVDFQKIDGGGKVKEPPAISPFYGETNVRLSFPITVALTLYGVIGPGVTLGHFLHFKADTVANPWWEVRLGYQVSAFMENSFWEQDPRRVRLPDVATTVLHAGAEFEGMRISPDKDELKTTVGGSLALELDGLTSGRTVTWKVVKGPGWVTGDEDGAVYRSGKNGIAVVEAYSPATWQSPVPYRAHRTITVGTGEAKPDGVLDIMVVGDSISQGLEGDYTWRYRLHQHLAGTKQRFRFVGPWTGTVRNPDRVPEGWPSTPTAPVRNGAYRPGIRFDSDHYAQWGWQMHQAKNTIADQVSLQQPDVILLELGFNDLGWGVSSPAGLIDDMKELVRNARSAKPGLRILVANVVHRGPLDANPNLPTTISRYNSLLPPAVFDLDPSGERVEVVDLNHNYDWRVDTYDDLHPNGVGEYKIAREFSRGLKLWGLISSPIGGVPSHVLELRPPAPASLRASPVASGIELTWQRVFGAGGYWIYQRDTTPGLGGTWSRAQFTIPSTTWRVGWLQDGHTYEFAIATARGRFVSAVSPKASARANLRTAAPPEVREVHADVTGINVTWNATPSGGDNGTVTGYQFYWFDRNVPAPALQQRRVNGTYTRLGGLVPGHKYVMAVAAINEYGEGTPTGVPAAIPGVPPPVAPRLTTAKVAGATEVDLEWTAVDGGANYWIFQQYRDGGYRQLPYPLEGTSFTAGYLLGGFTWDYWFCIEASNGTDRSPRSNCKRAELSVPSTASPIPADTRAKSRLRTVAGPPPVDARLLRYVQSQRLAQAARRP